MHGQGMADKAPTELFTKYNDYMNKVWENLKKVEPKVDLLQAVTTNLHEWVKTQLDNAESITKYASDTHKKTEHESLIELAKDPKLSLLYLAHYALMKVLKHFLKKIPEAITNEIKEEDVVRSKMLNQATLSYLTHETVPVHLQSMLTASSPWPALHTLTNVVDRMQRDSQRRAI